VHPFHERLARVGLAAAAPYGFCLAGGYAVQAHGMVDRRSKDIDLFTSTTAAGDFPTAVDVVLAALYEDGLDVSVSRQGPTFARLEVVDPASGEPSVMELGVDWRAYPPVTLAIGPVLHPDDAVANKVCALFGRAEVRDYVDVHGALCSGRYTGEDLLRLAANHDPGFDRDMFADALRAVRRFPHSAFEPYALSESDVGLLCDRLLAWADEISGGAG
jgi:hypothetical protein